MDFSAAVERVIEMFFPAISRKRREHSLSVANMTAGLCRRFGLDAECGRLAGMAHDIARELTSREMAETAARDGRPFLPYEMDNPLLVHGRAAAVLLDERLGIGETVMGTAVLDAIRDHTLGRSGMGPLSKALFVADFLEPGRKYLKKKDFRAAGYDDLDRIVLHVVERLNGIYREEGVPILEPSLRLYEEMKDKVASHGKKR
jgi:predicted HD superfamily hydrolase involved in NAD metabolism